MNTVGLRGEGHAGCGCVLAALELEADLGDDSAKVDDAIHCAGLFLLIVIFKCQGAVLTESSVFAVVAGHKYSVFNYVKLAVGLVYIIGKELGSGQLRYFRHIDVAELGVVVGYGVKVPVSGGDASVCYVQVHRIFIIRAFRFAFGHNLFRGAHPVLVNVNDDRLVVRPGLVEQQGHILDVCLHLGACPGDGDDIIARG